MNKFAVEDRVRWSDVDRAGIIYFGSYVRFFEIAETELFREMGLPYSRAFELLDAYPVRKQFHCDFLSPAYLDDLLTVHIWSDHVGNTSMRLCFEVTRTASDKGRIGERLMTGNCTLVAVNRTTFRPVRVPELLRTAIQPFLEESN